MEQNGCPADSRAEWSGICLDAVCPKCKIELRAKERTPDGRTVLVCRNPRCENYQRVVKELK